MYKEDISIKMKSRGQRNLITTEAERRAFVGRYVIVWDGRISWDILGRRIGNLEPANNL